jgi:hypothetical protein
MLPPQYLGNFLCLKAFLIRQVSYINKCLYDILEEKLGCRSSIFNILVFNSLRN